MDCALDGEEEGLRGTAGGGWNRGVKDLLMRGPRGHGEGFMKIEMLM